MNLIVGATGMVGGEICKLLAEQGKPVRALVRNTSNPESVARLTRLGAEIVKGDIKDRVSLDNACHGVTAVISTASSTRTPREGDTLASVDQQGQLNVIDAAKEAGVQHFVFVSFPPIDLEFPLQTAKRAAEERLKQSGMTYTILQPTCFMEVWLSPHLGFDVTNSTARIYGKGENKISWISFQDVAKFAVASLDASDAKNAVIQLGGPEALSPLEVVQLAQQITGKQFEVEHVPEEALRAQFDAATNPMQKSFAGLMLFYAGGSVIDMKNPLRVLPVQPLKTVREYLQATVAIGKAAH